MWGNVLWMMTNLGLIDSLKLYDMLTLAPLSRTYYKVCKFVTIFITGPHWRQQSVEREDCGQVLSRWRRWGGPRKLVDTSRSSTSQQSQTTSSDCKELQTGHSGILKIQFSNDLVLLRYTGHRHSPHQSWCHTATISAGQDAQRHKESFKNVNCNKIPG